jgi:hypothetical protein
MLSKPQGLVRLEGLGPLLLSVSVLTTLGWNELANYNKTNVRFHRHLFGYTPFDTTRNVGHDKANSLIFMKCYTGINSPVGDRKS